MAIEFRLLRADEIEARINTVNQYGVSVLLYKNARCDMQLLDETVGAENWQRSHVVINDNLFCNVSIKCGAEWVTKQDVGVESYTEAEKGEASDSFKRACTCWGVGRELYTAPDMFIFAKDLKTLKQDNNGKWTCKDHFIVKSIEYDGRKIAYVELFNKKTLGTVTFGTPVEVEKKTEAIKKAKVSAVKALALKEKCEKENVNMAGLAKLYGVHDLGDLTEIQYRNVLNNWDQILKL